MLSNCSSIWRRNQITLLSREVSLVSCFYIRNPKIIEREAFKSFDDAICITTEQSSRYLSFRSNENIFHVVKLWQRAPLMFYYSAELQRRVCKCFFNGR